MSATPYEEKYKKNYDDTLESVKTYIKSLKLQKKKVQSNAQSVKTNSESAKYDFQYSEFCSMHKELLKYFITSSTEFETLSDEDVTRRREELDGKVKLIHSLSAIVKELVGLSSDTARKSITKQYDLLQTSKLEYIKLLEASVKSRQLDQKKLYNRSKLNIEIPKFKGYSGIDIYTFKSKFEKLHPASLIPKEHLLEQLLNSIINPALLLVKDATDISSVWTRLIEAYGDSKRLLDKKNQGIWGSRGNV